MPECRETPAKAHIVTEGEGQESASQKRHLRSSPICWRRERGESHPGFVEGVMLGACLHKSAQREPCALGRREVVAEK